MLAMYIFCEFIAKKLVVSKRTLMFKLIFLLVET